MSPGAGAHHPGGHGGGRPQAPPQREPLPVRHVTRGDAKAALAKSKYVVTQSYRTPFTEHAFLEPECAVAFPYKDGVKVYTSDQGVYDTRKEIAIMLGWEPERIVVEKQAGGRWVRRQGGRVGAAHGRAGRPEGGTGPVKVKFSRQESITFHPKRHYMEGTFTLGCDENGIFTGLDCEIYFDTGAYASLCGPVLERPVPTPWAPTATRTPTSGAMATTPTTRPPAPSGASASARANSPWSPTSTCWPRRWASPLGDPLPQCHRAGQGAAQRPDSRLLHRPQGDPGWRCGRPMSKTPDMPASPAP